MTRLKAVARCLVIAGFLYAFLPGFAYAAETKTVRDDFAQRVAGIRMIGILTPDFTYYDSSLSGLKEKNDDQSRQAAQNIVNTVKDFLTAQGFTAKVIARDGERKESLEEIAELFETIAFSYRIHVTRAQRQNVFPHKAASFDYSVGPIGDILDAEQVDALILVEGGSVGASLLNPGGAVILVGLVDRTGALLWHEPYTQQGSGFLNRKNLTDPDGTRRIFETIFGKMPAVRK